MLIYLLCDCTYIFFGSVSVALLIVTAELRELLCYVQKLWSRSSAESVNQCMLEKTSLRTLSGLRFLDFFCSLCVLISFHYLCQILSVQVTVFVSLFANLSCHFIFSFCLCQFVSFHCLFPSSVLNVSSFPVCLCVKSTKCAIEPKENVTETVIMFRLKRTWLLIIAVYLKH